jgi:adenylyltransferase/sulfurtransferase
MSIDRYQRQQILPQIGVEGQHRLGRAAVLLIGCGALGTTLADLLVRAGVGFIRLVDRDWVELTNLQRQVLFDEQDAAEQVPKAVAAARRLKQVNSSVTIEPIVADVNAGNISELALNLVARSSPLSPSPGTPGEGGGEGGFDDSRPQFPHPNPPPEYQGRGQCDLILDGTDNVATRYLINDYAVKNQIPWIYGACVGVSGRMMAIWPGKTACLRCLFPAPPRADELPTCDTAGVLGSAAALVASMQASAAIRFLVDQAPDGTEAAGLISINAWDFQIRSLASASHPQPDCPCCGRGEFPFLCTDQEEFITTLCGRQATQVQSNKRAKPVDLSATARRLSQVGVVQTTAWFIRCQLTDPRGIDLTLFADGRLLVHGTTDPLRAKSIYARFIGN